MSRQKPKTTHLPSEVVGLFEWHPLVRLCLDLESTYSIVRKQPGTEPCWQTRNETSIDQ